MADFDLSGYLSDDTFVVSGVPSEKYPAPDGQRYAIPSPSARDGLLLKKIFNSSNGAAGDKSAKAVAISPELAEYCKDADGNPIDFDEKLLGAALPQMIADGVSSTRLDMISEIVYIRFASNQGMAEMLVEAAGKAEARDNRATRRAAAKKPTSTARTPRAKAGSASKKASTATRARTPAPRSTASSTSTPRKAAAKKAS